MGAESDTKNGGSHMNSIPFTLDSESKSKLYFQLYQKIVDSIKNGLYLGGTKLPSVRELSQELTVSRNTVNTAYKMLVNEGYITARAKSGFVVNETKQESVTINEPSTQENEGIPTVETVVKFRKGTEIQEIPLPEDFEEVTGSDTTKEELSKKTQKVFEEKSEAEIVSDNKEEVKVELETPVEIVTDTIKDTELQQITTVFGNKELRKAIARYVYHARSLPCTSGQVIVADTKEELLVKAIQFLSPITVVEHSVPHSGVGLLKLAEDVSKGQSIKDTFTNEYYKVAFSDAAASLFSQLPSEIKIEPFDDESNAGMAVVESAGSSVAVVIPLYKEIEQTEESESEGQVNLQYKNLLDWAEKSPDHYIIEIDTSSQNDFSFERPLMCYSKSKKVL